MNKRIREWLQQKNPTERRVAIMLFFLCVATFYGCGLYLPLSRTVDVLQARCDKLQQDLIWLDKQARIRGVLPQRSPSAPVANVIKRRLNNRGSPSRSRKTRVADWTLPLTVLTLEPLLSGSIACKESIAWALRFSNFTPVQPVPAILH